MTTTTTYEPVIQQVLDKYERWKAQTIALNEQARILTLLKAEFDDLVTDTNALTTLTAILYVSNSQQIVTVLRFLRQHGYKVDHFSDHAQSQNRDYYLVHVDDDEKKLTVAVYFRGPNATCTYVQVGTKHVEARDEPVMELRCGDEAIPEGN